MKKIFSAFVITALLTGCETAMQGLSMSQNSGSALSCGEITKAFTAYKNDRQSVDALAVLAPLVSANADANVKNVSTSSNQYYEQAKASANLALAVQGCQSIN